MGGLRAGYDWVNGSAIYGVLSEASFGNQSSVREIGQFLDIYKIGSEVKTFGSIRAKAGVVSEKIALFATAGVAFADIRHKYADTANSSDAINAKGDGTGYVFGACIRCRCSGCNQ